MRVALPMFELLQPFDVAGDHRARGRELVWIAMIQSRRRGPATSSPGSAELVALQIEAARLPASSRSALMGFSCRWRALLTSAETVSEPTATPE